MRTRSPLGSINTQSVLYSSCIIEACEPGRLRLGLDDWGDRVAIGKQPATEYYCFRWRSQPSGLGAALRLFIEMLAVEARLEHASIR